MTEDYHLNLFQLTHPWGCDIQFFKRYQFDGISTHTPVRVWPCKSSFNRISYHYFNSHTREGVTLQELVETRSKYISTHTPVRVWHILSWWRWLLLDFNSHTREGVTFTVRFSFHRFFISTHTPVRVWLFILPEVLYIAEISTHTPVRVWHVRVFTTSIISHFNSHTREGVT